VALLLGVQLVLAQTPGVLAQGVVRDSIELRLTRELSELGRVRLPELRFVKDGDRLASGGDVLLRRVARSMASVPGSFVVEAHVKPTGDEISDQAMADRRASTVRASLIQLGVPATRLFAVGFGRAKVSRQRARKDSVASTEIENIEIARLQ
jgi:outer membrane protein OmpA-like peptidoglycan-associated protein